MATVKYLYPPNFDLFYDNENVGLQRVVVQVTSEPGDASDVDWLIVAKQDHRMTNGEVPTRLVIERIDFAIEGQAVVLEWDTPTDEQIAVLTGRGCLDWRSIGGKTPSDTEGSGNIIISTPNHGADDSYDVTISVRFRG